MAESHRLLRAPDGFLVVLLFWATMIFPAGGAATIHDLLRDHGLPAGLLPKAVRSFSLDAATGLLEARLDGPCYASWRDNPVHFDSVVAGNLSYGELRGVVGLSQEELFLWLPVKGVLVADPSSGVLLLDIGVARKQLSLSVFEDPPDCQPAGKAESQGFPARGSGLLRQRLGSSMVERPHDQRR